MTDHDLRQLTAAGFRDLVDWAQRASFADIPEPILHRAALILVDDIAAITAARTEPEVTGLLTEGAWRQASPEATVFIAPDTRCGRVDAASMNAVAANWCELDPGYRRVGCHAGLYIVPALAAEAEATGLTLSDVLRALVLAYEIVARVADCWQFPSPRPTHPHATFGALGAGLAIGLLRDIGATALRDVSTGAATLLTMGPFGHVVAGATIRNCWAALGAESGFRVNSWATAGIRGLPESPYDVYAGILGATTRPAYLTEKLGTAWAVLDGYHKIYSCCQHAHSTVEAVISLAADHDAVRVRRISRNS